MGLSVIAMLSKRGSCTHEVNALVAAHELAHGVDEDDGIHLLGYLSGTDQSIVMLGPSGRRYITPLEMAGWVHDYEHSLATRENATD